MSKQKEQLFQMPPDGENQGGIVEKTWKDEALEQDMAAFRAAPRDAFDHRDKNYPQTTGQIREETLEGHSPRETGRRQNAFASIVQVEASLEGARMLREVREAQVERDKRARIDQIFRDSLK